MFVCEEAPVAANDNNPECPQCGTHFAFRAGKKFCSRVCKKRYGSRHDVRHRNAPERICAGCGVTFRRKTSTKDAAKFCSRECAFSYNVQGRLASQESRELAASFRVSYSVRRAKCQDCGSWTTSQNGRLRCEECDIIHKRNRQDELRGVVRANKTCPECGTLFIAPYGRGAASYCSNECSNKRNKRIGRSRRRARERDAANDNVDPIEVFNRDGWRCQMCKARTPHKLRGTHEPRAPELDHIVPLSKGGEHSYRNTQCLCRSCNMSKGAKLLGQLRLFG
jgi:5-methylcytosine-specific restriction endonuclease McrA